MSNRVPKFLPEDFELLLQKIAELETRLIDCGQELGESTEQSSETWHDNATYDTARMQFDIIAEELQKLIETRNSAQIITPPFFNEEIGIGNVVLLKNTKTGEKHLLKITGNTV